MFYGSLEGDRDWLVSVERVGKGVCVQVCLFWSRHAHRPASKSHLVTCSHRKNKNKNTTTASNINSLNIFLHILLNILFWTACIFNILINKYICVEKTLHFLILLELQSIIYCYILSKGMERKGCKKRLLKRFYFIKMTPDFPWTVRDEPAGYIITKPLRCGSCYWGKEE